MNPSDSVPTALAEIALTLRQESYDLQAADIETLREWALSHNEQDSTRFRTEITQNKWYWLGMGTIADISFHDRELNGRFIRAYYGLAVACESEGLGSIYSRDIFDIFGRWIRDGVV
jgi:hypothetical protein